MDQSENRGSLVAVQRNMDIESMTSTVRPVVEGCFSMGFLYDNPAIYTTMDLANPDHAAIMFDCSTGDSENTDAFLNRVIRIAHVTVMPKIYKRGTPEERAGYQAFIITDEDEIIRTGSDGILKSLVFAQAAKFSPFGDREQAFTLKNVSANPPHKYIVMQRVKPEQDALESSGQKKRKGK